MIATLIPALAPLFSKVIDVVGGKIGVDMNSDEMKSKRMEIELEMAKMLNSVDLKQLEINLAEASNPSRTYPTWREVLGYVCGLAVAYHFVLQQFLAFIFSAFGKTIILPTLEMSGLMTILSTMLGVHFVDSRYNSPPNIMPDDRKKSTGQVVYDPEAGGTIWKPD